MHFYTDGCYILQTSTLGVVSGAEFTVTKYHIAVFNIANMANNA